MQNVLTRSFKAHYLPRYLGDLLAVLRAQAGGKHARAGGASGVRRLMHNVPVLKQVLVQQDSAASDAPSHAAAHATAGDTLPVLFARFVLRKGRSAATTQQHSATLVAETAAVSGALPHVDERHTGYNAADMYMPPPPDFDVQRALLHSASTQPDVRISELEPERTGLAQLGSVGPAQARRRTGSAVDDQLGALTQTLLESCIATDADTAQRTQRTAAASAQLTGGASAALRLPGINRRWWPRLLTPRRGTMHCDKLQSSAHLAPHDAAQVNDTARATLQSAGAAEIAMLTGAQSLRVTDAALPPGMAVHGSVVDVGAPPDMGRCRLTTASSLGGCRQAHVYGRPPSAIPSSGSNAGPTGNRAVVQPWRHDAGGALSGVPSAGSVRMSSVGSGLTPSSAATTPADAASAAGGGGGAQKHTAAPYTPSLSDTWLGLVEGGAQAQEQPKSAASPVSSPRTARAASLAQAVSSSGAVGTASAAADMSSAPGSGLSTVAEPSAEPARR